MISIKKHSTNHYEMACDSVSYTPFCIYRLLVAMRLLCGFLEVASPLYHFSLAEKVFGEETFIFKINKVFCLKFVAKESGEL